MISDALSLKYEQARKANTQKNGQHVSYDEAETLLLKLGFTVRSRGSHHVFSKDGYEKNISVKNRSELLPYQLRLIKEAIESYEE